jgi:hypothetical protein
VAYDIPPASDLKIRYPAFTGVDNTVVDYWINDAKRFVTTSWIETDYAPGLMALAAHNMAIGGLGTGGAALAELPAGVSRFKSGSLDVTLTDAAANARMTGDYSSTIYGQEYLRLLGANRGGPLVAPTGAAPYDYVDPTGWPNGFA